MRRIEEAPEVTLRLEGELMGLEVAELRRVASALLGDGRALRLDLADVTFADGDGIALLLELRAHGAVWANASIFVLCLLEGG